jgi:hypothetical protein
MTKRNRPIKITITNIYADGSYTAPLYVGSQKTPVNVYLDTGSSTLAVSQKHYHGNKDRNLKPTNYAQSTAYLDDSFWTGAVVNTRLAVRHGNDIVRLDRANIAVIDHQNSMFTKHNQGILGLAYKALNYAYEYKSPTWPKFNHKIIQKQPQTVIDPYFTQLEKNGTLANKFAFYTLRTAIHHGKRPIDKDPLNRGYLVLGGGEEYKSLYQGEFSEVKILHDYYYNTHISSVRVGKSRRLKVKRSTADSGLFSNSIVDNGTTYIVFPTWLHKKVIQQFHAINPKYTKAIYDSNEYEDFELSPAAISKWPNIYITMEGSKGDVELCVRPETYWQANTTKNGVAFFTITSGADDQTILGLPFMNNFYTIFDRSANDGTGTIKFAKPKQP